MKKRHWILIFLFVFGMALFLTFWLWSSALWEGDGMAEEAGEEIFLDVEKNQRRNEMTELGKAYELYIEELTEFLDSFLDLTYNCNYQERRYYEGAEEYMTEECYSSYVPMQSPEDGEESRNEDVVPYASYLLNMEYYFAFPGSGQAECLAVVQYASSGVSEEILENILSIALMSTEEGWKINRIETLDL